jgi:DNA polymerase-3 subunit epsilon
MMHMDFVAIDFETATGHRHSACAVAVVTVSGGKITDKYFSLIRPPDNLYWRGNIAVHGIRPEDTQNVPCFDELYPEMRQRIQGRTVVAHNESFDRGVLRSTMEHYDLWYPDLELPVRWECTLSIYRQKGFKPCRLSDCCRRMKIPLNHHEALSDAMACAQLYLMQ